MVVFDFDGVFTDGKFYFGNNQCVTKCYNAKDSWAIKLLNAKDIKTGVITLDPYVSIENAPHIFPRLDKACIVSDKPKLDILKEWCVEYNIDLSEVAYIGDDLPDIPVLKNVGFSACPSDAVNEVKKVCDYICTKSGGNGAVREFVDLILNLINCVLDCN